MITVEDCPLGSVVEMYLNSVPALTIRDAGRGTIECTILAIDTRDNMRVMGIKTPAPAMCVAQTKGLVVQFHQFALGIELSQYPHFAYVYPKWEVARIISTGSSAVATAHTGGMACARCYDHNAYATPNQPNGKFLCFSCRSCGYAVP